MIHLYLDAKETDRNTYPLIFGEELIINPIYRHVIINGEPLELTRTEFDLLFYMAKHPNQIFSRQQLYRQVWGDYFTPRAPYICPNGASDIFE